MRPDGSSSADPDSSHGSQEDFLRIRKMIESIVDASVGDHDMAMLQKQHLLGRVLQQGMPVYPPAYPPTPGECMGCLRGDPSV